MDTGIIKRLAGVLLAVLMLLTGASALAQEDLPHQIWHEMAEAGKKDLTDAWEMMGMFTFGETTGEGYVTIFVSEETGKIHDGISLRMYQKKEGEIREQYFPMLKVLTERFAEEADLAMLEVWLGKQQEEMVAAWRDNRDQTSNTQMFLNYEIYVQYDRDHNELYCLMTAIRDSQYMSMKQAK